MEEAVVRAIRVCVVALFVLGLGVVSVAGAPPALAALSPYFSPATTVVQATSDAGATVDYTATATFPDDSNAVFPADCTTASGSAFVVGLTEVACTATDTNTSEPATGTIEVIVQEPGSACTQVAAYGYECTYQYTGTEQTFVVPDGTCVLSMRAVGGSGGPSNLSSGGAGAVVSSSVVVNASGGACSGDLAPSSDLYLYVGGNASTNFDTCTSSTSTTAINGAPNHDDGDGGASVGCGGGGGAASVVQMCSDSDSACNSLYGQPGDQRLEVAGGGGGAAVDELGPGGTADAVADFSDCGAASYCNGGNGSGEDVTGGAGGTQSGPAGRNGEGGSSDGSLPSGAGGGGFYGGDAGLSIPDFSGGGGAGSSLALPFTSQIFGQNTGGEAPSITIEYTLNGNNTCVDSLSGSTTYCTYLPPLETFSSASAITAFSSSPSDFVVPSDVKSVTFTAIGGSGGIAGDGTPGGFGARVSASFSVNGGDNFLIAAGQPGDCCGANNLFGSGGPGGVNGGYGGGASVVEDSSNNPLVVAGGGGGGGNSGGCGDCGTVGNGASTGGNAGNGTSGESGQPYGACTSDLAWQAFGAGGGATMFAVGTGGAGDTANGGADGGDGAGVGAGSGGSGGGSFGGGGGGGYTGGGGGGDLNASESCGGGGGAGSSWVGSSASGTPTYQEDDPLGSSVTVSYSGPTVAPYSRLALQRVHGWTTVTWRSAGRVLGFDVYAGTRKLNRQPVTSRTAQYRFAVHTVVRHVRLVAIGSR
jgi:hypothetical protein